MTRRYGLIAALVVLIADQASKWWLIGLLATHPFGIRLTPFFNLVQVWNRGVSFGMFNMGESGGRWILVGLALVMAAALLVWLGRVAQRHLAIAIGAIIGGALGNAVDRLHHGAVADFLDFHLGRWHWPAFNLADSAIVLGVAVLLIDALFRRPEEANR